MPLAITFMDSLGVARTDFHPNWGQETSNKGSGIILVKDLRPMLWEAELTGQTLPPNLADQAEADLMSLEGSMTTLYVYNPRRPYPQGDPDGTILGASSVSIHTIGSDNKSVRMKGLPAAYVLTKGDMLAFDYGAGPSRALHQLTSGATAASNGITPSFNIQPAFRTGVAVNNVITLVKPAAEMRIIPGSDSISSDGAQSVIKFRVRQVL